MCGGRGFSIASLGIPARAATAEEAMLAPFASGGLRVRRNLAGMSPQDPDLQAFRYAVGVMRGDSSAVGWDTQRRVHAAPWAHHNSWRFMAWHRFQLYYFERIVARVSGKPDFAMPYWDWNSDRPPAAFFDRRSPLFDESRTINAYSRLSRYLGFEWGDGRHASSDFWGRTDNDFGDFFGSLNPTGAPGQGYAGSAEQYGHNIVHLYAGGRMRNLLESPLDPLFWAHHSNVDRQWAMWSEQHAPSEIPREFLAESCTGYVDGDGFLARARTAGECLNTRQMGFTYDDLGQRARPQAEAWAGQADAGAPPVVQATLNGQAGGNGVVRAFIRPELLTNLPGARAPHLDVKGFLRVVGVDGYTVRLSSRSADGRYLFGQDALFSVPMGDAIGVNAMGHRVQLQRLVPRDPRALAEGFWIEAVAGPLRGEVRSMQPQVISMVVNYRSQL